MPIFPSDVDGVEPGALARDGGEGKRLRELCEVLLTARAKMLGLSKSFAHRLSSLPPDLKSSLVSGLGEIVAHLDEFQIQLGDTRLTGKVGLGADVGMDAHFPSGPGVVHVDVKGTYRGAMETRSELRKALDEGLGPRPNADPPERRRRRRSAHDEIVETKRREREEAAKREEVAKRQELQREEELALSRRGNLARTTAFETAAGQFKALVEEMRLTGQERRQIEQHFLNVVGELRTTLEL